MIIFFPVINNDLLATFSGFNYRQVPLFITDNNAKNFTVRVDQYSAITVSESMIKMIRKMNSFRRSGRLTHRGKRARVRLEKWKKADARQFDKSLINNPLDAVDLAEFIF